MKVAVASDHRGYEAKRRLLPILQKNENIVTDFGCDSIEAVDYPDYAIPLARAVADGTCDIGILLDGSGIGMTIAANKVRGVRAALAHDEVTARRSREHHHCNVLCLGVDLLSDDQIRRIITTFLGTHFAAGRHVRRLKKIEQLESEHHPVPAVAKSPLTAASDNAATGQLPA